MTDGYHRARLCQTLARCVRAMDNGEEKLEAIRQRIDVEVIKVLTWAAMFEAMDQETATLVEIPSYALGEAGRSIRKAALAIQEHLDELNS